MSSSTQPIADRRHGVRKLFDSLRADRLFLLLLAGLVVFGINEPARIGSFPSLVDWPTIAALTGLLALTKGIEASHAMPRLADRLLTLLPTERALALAFTSAAALLSTVLTNDVALFVVVPLTLSVCRITGVSSTRLIVFEALAVNAGSALTPIGNPQNLFLWQRSASSFADFTLHMLPLVAGLMVLLLALTALAFSTRALHLGHDAAPQPLDRVLLLTSVCLYLPFLIATDLHYAGWAVALVLIVLLLLRRGVLAQLDWGLLLVFVLMFIDLRLLAGVGMIKQAMLALGLDNATHLYLAAIATSQVVSNVPAAIALAEYTSDWRVLAYGVNVGGFGLMIGSLANLIALRMCADRRAMRDFHLYSMPFLVVAALLGFAVLVAKGMR